MSLIIIVWIQCMFSQRNNDHLSLYLYIYVIFTIIYVRTYMINFTNSFFPYSFVFFFLVFLQQMWNISIYKIIRYIYILFWCTYIFIILAGNNNIIMIHQNVHSLKFHTKYYQIITNLFFPLNITINLIPKSYINK